MLALFNEEVKIPEELEMFESVCRSRPVLPLAFQPLTEEEQVLHGCIFFLVVFLIFLLNFVLLHPSDRIPNSILTCRVILSLKGKFKSNCCHSIST